MKEYAKITICENIATVHDFIGFTADWDEIIVPVDREAVKALKAQGYTIEYTSDDI